MEIEDETDIFSALGGDESLFFALVDAFYRRVETDPPLRAMYPADLAPGKERLAWFLIQRFGGPSHFNDRRGAPMLRRRHAQFAITIQQAGRWHGHMSGAIDDVPQFASYKPLMLRYFEDAAMFLVNSDDEGVPRSRMLPTERHAG